MSKSRSKSQTKRSTSQGKTEPVTVLSSDDIDELISDITMKRPPSAYVLYIMDCWQEENKKIKDKSEKKSMIEVGQMYHTNWPDKIEKKKMDHYKEEHQRLKEKYEHDIEVVKAILIDQFDNKGATAMRLFYNEREKQAIINNEPVDEALKQAREDWKQMSPEDKKFWKEKKQDNDRFWDVSDKVGRINSYLLFCNEKRKEWKDTDKKATAKNIAEEWKEVPKKKKLQYEQEAEKFNEMRERYAEMLKIKNGIMPTRPRVNLIIFNLL